MSVSPGLIKMIWRILKGVSNSEFVPNNPYDRRIYEEHQREAMIKEYSQKIVEKNGVLATYWLINFDESPDEDGTLANKFSLQNAAELRKELVRKYSKFDRKNIDHMLEKCNQDQVVELISVLEKLAVETEHPVFLDYAKAIKLKLTCK